jgi:hypothetical protein
MKFNSWIGGVDRPAGIKESLQSLSKFSINTCETRAIKLYDKKLVEKYADLKFKAWL